MLRRFLSFNVSSYQLNSQYNFVVLLFVELAVAERDSKSASVSFSFFFVGPSQKGSQAFRAETVETGDKNRHDLHSMQMSLVMSMRFIFGGD